MKVRLMDVNGDPVEIFCNGTDELKAAIDVLQDKGVLPEPENENDETDEPEPAAAVTPAAELAADELQDGQERQGA